MCLIVTGDVKKGEKGQPKSSQCRTESRINNIENIRQRLLSEKGEKVRRNDDSTATGVSKSLKSLPGARMNVNGKAQRPILPVS